MVESARAEEGPCGWCTKSEPCIRLHFFVGDHAGKSLPICWTCLKTMDVEGEIALVDPTPAPSRRKILRRQKKLSQVQEVAIAEELEGRTQRASGALPWQKGDVRKKNVCRIEAKYTEADSYRVCLDDLYKIRGECHGAERPVLVIDFLEKHTGKQKDRFAVVHFEDLKELLNASRNHR